MSLDRRHFLQWLAGLGSALVIGGGQAVPSPKRHTRVIPSSGEPIPAVGMGSWLTFGIDPDDPEEMAQRLAVMREFLGQGGGVLDSSPMYGSAQEVIGRCLERIGNHEGLFSATKVWTRGNREGLLQMGRSQFLWGLPRLDLMQVHNLLDWKTHLPTLQAMKAEGKIRYLGVTTSHGRRHEELLDIMRTQELDFVQFTYNLRDREAEQALLPMAEGRGIAVIINRPFQRGGLFDYVGKEPLPDWAVEIDCDNWAQFFLKFIISHPAVTCTIPATSRVDHLQQNMAAAYGRLPGPEMRREMVDYIDRL
jgi:diketogulonate reductase-like aldo/keto reductase